MIRISTRVCVIFSSSSFIDLFKEILVIKCKKVLGIIM